MRVLWVTNYQAPYRTGLWRGIAGTHSLTVFYLAGREPQRKWRFQASPTPYSERLCPSLRFHAPGDDEPRFLLKPGFAGGVVSQYDVVVLGGWDCPAYWQLLRTAKRARKPICGFYESTTASHRFKAGPIATLRRLLLGAMDSILTVGIASRDTLLAMGISSGKIIMGFNAVDVRRYAQDARGMRRGVPPLPGHHTLYVGRLIEGKNIQSALIAWVKARRPEDTFTVVGSGPLEDRLVSLVHQLQIQDSVRFVGHLSGDRLTSEYARAQTLILPSTKEVWGLVVNEALASGIHAVVSDAAGVAASVAGMPGVFVAHPDITSLAAALEASRSSWRGPIDNPPILEQSPEQLAVAALEAIDLAIRVYRK